MACPDVIAPPDEQMIDAAVTLAERLLRRAIEIEYADAWRAQRRRARLASVVNDEAVAELVRALTDEVLRIDDTGIAARRFSALVAESTLAGFGALDRWSLRAGALLAPRLPRLVMPLVVRRVRREAGGTVVIDREPAISRHLARAGGHEHGLRSNVNVLGEAILGPAEAERRLRLVEAAIARADVDYLSVKISAVCSRVSVLAFDATVDAVSESLRRILRAASAAAPTVFVNLDMEEYRDLHLTVAAFERVLAEPEFASVESGVVVQAYLPDSHEVARELCEFARARVESGGAGIKIRLVKGANLAMESVEAELHGWDAAPYPTKADVDANYKAILDLMLDARYDRSVRVGVASHNLFDVAWAIGLRDELDRRGAADRIDFEMLDGMVPAQARAVAETVGGVLLYTPVVRPDDFTAAIAYLVRRLDENTGLENYLRSVFEIAPGTPPFEREASRFRTSVRSRHDVSTAPRRANAERRPQSTPAPITFDTFGNEPDTDMTAAEARAAIAAALAAPYTATDVEIVDRAGVDRPVKVARDAQPGWARVPFAERRDRLLRVAEVVADRRFEIIATMAHEAGKPATEGDPEVSEAIDFARWYAAAVSEIEQRVARGAAVDPLGVVVVAPPWNFPFAIPMGGVLAALAAGNAVVLKPAPQTRATARLVAQCCWDAGVPTDVVQYLPCDDDEAGRALITHHEVDAVVFTGSRTTADMFHDWKPALRLLGETSGKNAMVITASADLELAVRDLVRSAFGHGGQKCSAASLAIVERSVLDRTSFLDRLADATRNLVVGPAAALTTDIGPLIDAPTGPLLRALTELEPGESWLVEPRQLGGDGRLWSPGVRLGVQPGSWFHLTECFGPVLGVIAADGLDHAIELQNAPAFGLTAGLHSLDPGEIERWVDGVQAGNLYVNRTTTGAVVGRQPFGGWKQSVVGPTAKAGGRQYVDALCSWRAGELDEPDEPAVDHDPYRRWAQLHLGVGVDVQALRCESNVVRWRALPGGVALRVGPGASQVQVAAAMAAAGSAGCRVVRSDSADTSDDEFAMSLGSLRVDRLRVIGDMSDAIRTAAHRIGVVVDERPVSALADAELPRWLREQSVTITRHRHGHLARACPTAEGADLRARST